MPKIQKVVYSYAPPIIDFLNNFDFFQEFPLHRVKMTKISSLDLMRCAPNIFSPGDRIILEKNKKAP